ncbi:hypothetical protein HNQ92_003798 [Rhabdobacter roseus]|uniref:Uncharacterized protein n=1 Tax=Rhabdobacter roseus TaxID=1655419 RepID=A0A840TZN6_9BACT|nr:hypothetical protein [Rhabdobacter roseus]MBB5285638.1 hypothetical protein [Rhabdobacter roseus]
MHRWRSTLSGVLRFFLGCSVDFYEVPLKIKLNTTVRRVRL